MEQSMIISVRHGFSARAAAPVPLPDVGDCGRPLCHGELGQAPEELGVGAEGRLLTLALLLLSGTLLALIAHVGGEVLGQALRGDLLEEPERLALPRQPAV